MREYSLARLTTLASSPDLWELFCQTAEARHLYNLRNTHLF